jgi:acylphosphatase
MVNSLPDANDTVARLVRYSGWVQGVGFRATTARMARSHPVTGYVKNLPDGQVEVLVEGQADAVTMFLQAVRDYWRRHIHQEHVQEPAPTGRYHRFDITH